MYKIIIFIIVGYFLFTFLKGLVKGLRDEDSSGVKLKTTKFQSHGRNVEHFENRPPEIDQYWEFNEWVNVKAKLKITYINAQGENSERIINISGYNGSAYLNVFCELRNENRTFRIDRIESAVDMTTGEIISNVPDYLLKIYQSSTEYKLEKTFAEHINIIKVLFYVGKSDGQLRAEERKLICSTIRTLAKNKEIPDALINKALNNLSVPSIQGFKLAFGKVCKKHPKQTKQIYILAKKIVDTQKSVSPAEKEALHYMIKKMKKDGIIP